jgi:thioredoxin-dependent peroxiredoxin
MSKLMLVFGLCLALVGPVAAQDRMELKVGDQAPAFSLPGTDGKTHTLSDYAGQHVVVAWYPAALTRGCTIECRSIRDAKSTIDQYKVAYFMASVDTEEKNLEFAKMEEANFPMLSDTGKSVAGKYGVLNDRGVADRWTFYIGPDQKIVKIDKTVNADVGNAGQILAQSLVDLDVPKN